MDGTHQVETEQPSLARELAKKYAKEIIEESSNVSGGDELNLKTYQHPELAKRQEWEKRSPKSGAIHTMLAWGIAYKESIQPTNPLGFVKASEQSLPQDLLTMRRESARASAAKAMERFYDDAQLFGQGYLETGYLVQADLLALPPEVTPGEVKKLLNEELLKTSKSQNNQFAGR